MNEKTPLSKKSFSIPVRPNSAQRFAPIMPVAAKGDRPPAQEPRTVSVESSTGLIFISAAKDIEKTISKYEAGLTEVEKERKEILRRAKEQAQELIREANRRIENTIREIREAQAEKEATRKLREDMKAFEADIQEVDSTANDEAIARKIAQLQARKERKEKRKAEKAKNAATNNSATASVSVASPTDSNPQPTTHNLIYIEDILTRSQAISVTRITTPENVTEMQINCRLRSCSWNG